MRLSSSKIHALRIPRCKDNDALTGEDRLRLIIMWRLQIRRARYMFFLLFYFLLTSHDSIDCWNYFRLLFLSLLLQSSRSKDSPTLTPHPPLSEEIFQSGDLGALDIFALSIPLPHALPHLSRQAWNLRHPDFTSPNVQRNTRRYSLMALTEAPIPCAQYLLLKLLTKSIQNPASDRQTALPSLPSKTPAEKLNGRSLWRFRFTIIMSAELDIEQ